MAAEKAGACEAVELAGDRLAMRTHARGEFRMRSLAGPRKTVTPTEDEEVVRIDPDRRRVRFGRFGYFDLVVAPVSACLYKWTSLGRVRIGPHLGY